MRKLFFPLVAVVGLTAMSFIKANIKHENIQNTPIEKIVDGCSKGVSLYALDPFRVYTGNVIVTGTDTDYASKMDYVLSHY